MTPEIHAGNNVTHDLGRGSKLQYELLNYLISLLLAVKKIVVKVFGYLLDGALCSAVRPCSRLPP